MPFKWSDVTERELLLVVIAESNAKPDSTIWDRVAQCLGEGLTASAVSQKFYKLKKESENVLARKNGGVANIPTTPTEKKGRAAKGTPNTKSASGKRKKIIDDDINENGDAGEDDTPVKPKKVKKETDKKVKTEKVDKAIVIAEENGEDYDDDDDDDNDVVA